MAIQNDALLQTRDAYNKTAQTYSRWAMELHPKTCAELFLKSVPPHGTILDIGCGSGRDAKIFSEQGHQITGIDFSSEMIKIAKETAPKATFMEADIQEINFPPQSFNGIWANASLLHIPKDNLKSVLLKIHSLLKEDGIFYMSVKKGNHEYFGHDQRYTEHRVHKFWSFYEPDEIMSILKESDFDVKNVDISKTDPIFIRTHSRRA